MKTMEIHSRHSELSTIQSTLRPLDIHIVYRKIEIYMVHMGDNDMHGARVQVKKQGHKHSRS